MKVDILICGAVSRPFSRMIMASGIDLIPEISGNAEEILKAYLEGNLFHSTFLMPGCKRYRLSRGRGQMPSDKFQRPWKKGKGRRFQS
jgi:predicted Fe-Mo cluster-binding NifX family protein